MEKPLPQASRSWSFSEWSEFEVLAGSESEPAPLAVPVRGGAEERQALFRRWLQQTSPDLPTGKKLASLLQGAALLLGLLGALLGIATLFGLRSVASDSIHLVLFLLSALAIPWLFLVLLAVGALLGAPARLSPAWGLLRLGLAKGLRSVLPGPTAVILQEKPFLFRLASLSQWLPLGFFLGLLAGFFACLMAFDTRFHWESSFGSATQGLLEATLGILETPWSWTGHALAPGREALEAAQQRFIGSEKLPPPANAAVWWPFLATALLVWGLLPRVLLWGAFRLAEKKALRHLSFDAVRHRRLWRALVGSELQLPLTAPEDEAVLLDLGGSQVALESLRPFLLQKLRIAPTDKLRVGVLDAAEEARALGIASQASGGVVLLIEDWAFAPKQCQALLAKIREKGRPELPIWLLVFDGSPGQPQPPSRERFAAVQEWTDQLQDPHTACIAWGAS
ncbi:MAG: DUF2868 domain-containing protein [Verrucomicrobiota bacterium]